MFQVVPILAAGLLGLATNAVERRLAGEDPAVSLARYDNYSLNARKDRFVPNPKFWAKGIDFSCASPWNSCGGSLKAGTLISKRHIVYANHFPLAVGSRIVFVGEDGGVCPCYLEKSKRIPNSDIEIGLLNAEITPNIHPAKILPEDFEKHIGNGKGLPIVTFNQREQLFLTVANPIPTNGSPGHVISCQAPKDKHLARFREKVVVGDSGNPAFLLFGDYPVLAYCLLRGGTGAGPALHTFRKKIQETMDELCPGYKLECFDFSKL